MEVRRSVGVKDIQGRHPWRSLKGPSQPWVLLLFLITLTCTLFWFRFKNLFYFVLVLIVVKYI